MASKTKGIIKQKYPKLVGKGAREQKKGLEVWPDNICQKRNKTCQIRSGGCGTRFKGGNKSWICPECFLDRRCLATKIANRPACRNHGAHAGRPAKHGKYSVPRVILDNYNRVLSDPDLLTLTKEISFLSARTQEIFDLINEQDVVKASRMLRSAIDRIDKGAETLNMLEVRAGVQQIYESLDPITVTFQAWREIKENLRVQAPLTKLQNEFLVQKEEYIPRHQVLEILVWWNRIVLKYIRDPADRRAYGKEIISLLPARKT